MDLKGILQKKKIENATELTIGQIHIVIALFTLHWCFVVDCLISASQGSDYLFSTIGMRGVLIGLLRVALVNL